MRRDRNAAMCFVAGLAAVVLATAYVKATRRPAPVEPPQWWTPAEPMPQVSPDHATPADEASPERPHDTRRP